MVWNAEQFRVLVFGYHIGVTATQVLEAMQEVVAAGLAVMYTVNGIEYIQLHDWKEHQKISHAVPSRLPACPMETSGTLQKFPEDSRKRSPDLDLDLDLDRIESTALAAAALPAPAAAPPPEPPVGEQPKKLRKKREPLPADAEWLAAVRALPVYAGLDVDRELGKLDAWLLTPKGRRRKKTSAFIVAWLNRALDDQREVGPQAAPARAATSGPRYPDWDKAFADMDSKALAGRAPA